MFLTAAILAFVKWYKAAEGVGWLYISALLAGMAVAAKMNAAFGLPVLIVVVLWNSRRLAMWRISLLVLIMATAAMPWYGLSYHWTENPVFPMMNGFFKGPVMAAGQHHRELQQFRHWNLARIDGQAALSPGFEYRAVR